MFFIYSYYTQPTGAPTIDPVKAALEKRATEAESQLDTDHLVHCLSLSNVLFCILRSVSLDIKW